MNKKFGTSDDPEPESIKDLLKGLDPDFLSDLDPEEIPDSEVSEVDTSDLKDLEAVESDAHVHSKVFTDLILESQYGT